MTARRPPRRRCPTCGRGVGGGWSGGLTAPELLTLAAAEVGEGADLGGETLPALFALRRELRRAVAVVEAAADARAEAWAAGEY